MKHFLPVVLVCGMLSAVHAQISPVQVTVQPQTKRRGSGGEYWSYT
ncbi:MAG: hypothetical protein N2689_15945 [Verrucomicrobiae bacterium]|nr:hypothetical protein [Verrucomicrobiae bacterium]